MKTLLINPPWYCFQNRKSSHIPLGIAYIAGALKAAGHDVEILNGEQTLAPHTIREEKREFAAFFHATDRYVGFHDIALPIWKILSDEIAEASPDVVGVSMWSGSYLSSINTCKIVKALNPEIVTVVGGIHPTLDPMSVIGDSAIDFVVCGEGENATVELWNVFETGRDIYEKAAGIQGVWTKNDGKIHNGGKTALIESINDIPLPDYGAVRGDASGAIMGIMTARGCPYNCTFCASKAIWGKNVRFRSVDSCIEELAGYKEKHGLRWFRINDDSFCIKKGRVHEFCDKFVESFGHGMNFAIDANVGTLGGEIIDKLEWAGCTGIGIGLESVVPRIQKLCRKRIDVDHAKKVIRSINRSKIVCGVYFMTGFPDETEKELRENMEFMKKTEPESSLWSVVTPYPGTELHNHAVQRGILPDVNPIHLMHHSLESSMAAIPHERYKIILHEILRTMNKIHYKHSIKRKLRELAFLRPLLKTIQNLKDKFQR